MKELVPHIFTFILPLFCANIVHMLVVRFRLLEFAAVPVAEKQFGKGKTWRGFLMMPFLTGIFYLCFNRTMVLQSFCFGMLLGFAYVIGELPNSFIKRRLGIAAGETSRFRVLQLFFDKMDSLIVLGIVYYSLMEITIPALLLLIAVSFFIHLVFSFLLFILGIKKNF